MSRHDPIEQFRRWFAEAQAAGFPDPDAMTLATIGEDGRPSARIVALRGIEDDALVFFTDGESRKGRELARDPRATLVFFWASLQRQVRWEGRVEPVAPAEADAYFASRPRGSQISATVSRQSSPVESREELERLCREAEARHAGRSIPRPERWTGYRFRPEAVEFWVGRPDRLHDRLRFDRSGDDWSVGRLQP